MMFIRKRMNPGWKSVEEGILHIGQGVIQKTQLERSRKLFLRYKSKCQAIGRRKKSNNQGHL